MAKPGPKPREKKPCPRCDDGNGNSTGTIIAWRKDKDGKSVPYERTCTQCLGLGEI